MPIELAELFNWRALTEALNLIVPPESFVFDTIFSNVETHASDTIDIDILVGNKRLAPFVSPVEGGIVISKLGGQLRTIKTPRLRMKLPLTANDLLLERAPGGNLYVTGGGNVTDARNRRIALEQQNLKDRITRRTEFMACKALSGGITVTQENISFNVDFLLPDDNNPVLSGSDKWDQAGSNPVEDIRAWKRLINQKTGLNADIAICGSKAVDAFLNNTVVKEILWNRRIDAGNIAITNSNFLGVLAGIQLYEYSAMYDDDSGTPQYLIPENTFVLISRQGRFVTHYGAILDLESPVMGQYFSKMWLEEDPSVYWLLAESRPLPTVHQPEAIVYATVV
ncbi:MAG: major capsid protein [Nitrospirae bacterium]|nr:major capsid protein [Nitrospirota bacterium]